MGTSLDDIRDFPDEVKQNTGYQLHLVQMGEMPNDFKYMPSIGGGVVEIRLKDADGISFIESSILPSLLMWFTYCTPLPKRPKRPHRQILT